MDYNQIIRQLALSFPEVSELPHFEKTSFRVKGKIFATVRADTPTLVVKLSVSDQDIFSLHPSRSIKPVPNTWGLQGWTQVTLPQLPDEMLREVLVAAYGAVAPQKLIDSLKNQ
jgi:hypothetical protein